MCCPETHATGPAERFFFGLAVVWCCGLKAPADDRPSYVSGRHRSVLPRPQGLQFIPPQLLCPGSQGVDDGDSQEVFTSEPKPTRQCRRTLKTTQK